MTDFNEGIRVYLAGPFFDETQRERISWIEETLQSYNFDIFSPRKASLIKPDSTPEDMIRTFDGNISHIDNCDFMLAILDYDGKSSDPGTVFETGYAFSRNKPILYFNETREKGPNLMLAMSGKLPFITGTTRTEEFFNINLNEATNDPRQNLKIVLNYIKKLGVNNVVKMTKNVFEEVE